MEKKVFQIGIIGSGNIGGTLGKHFAKAGHQVLFSSRHPEQLTDLVSEAGSNAKSGTLKEAADFGEIILLAAPFGKTPSIKDEIGSLEGKVLIDANNYYSQRDGDEPAKEMAEKGLLESEWTAHYFSGAHVGKAFNTIYFMSLKDKAFPSKNEVLAIPFAASDDQTSQTIKQLLDDIGFAGVYIGDLSATKIIQPNEALYNKELTTEEMKKLHEKER